MRTVEGAYRSAKSKAKAASVDSGVSAAWRAVAKDPRRAPGYTGSAAEAGAMERCAEEDGAGALAGGRTEETSAARCLGACFEVCL